MSDIKNKTLLNVIDWVDKGEIFLNQSNDTKNFIKEYFGKPPEHNDNACKALEEYEEECSKIEIGYIPGQFIPFNFSRLMKEIATKYGVTIKEMKEHWRCIEQLKSIK